VGSEMCIRDRMTSNLGGHLIQEMANRPFE